MTEPVIEATGLTKDHRSDILRRRFRVVDGLTLRVDKNETYGLLGLNGAGKTTTLKLLLGLLKPTSGSVLVLGVPAGHPSALARLGFLPENPYYYSYLTAREFLDLSGALFGMPRKERRQRAAELLEMVSMTKAADTAVRKYSKGMLQRLGIAQALMNDPQLVFLDEPMSGLDPVGRRDVRQIMIKLKSQGKTIFFNSHLLPDVNEVCDRVGILHRGKLVAGDRIEAISQRGHYQELEEYFMSTVADADKMAADAGSGSRASGVTA